MIEEIRSLSKENIISLVAACVFLGFCFAFPIRGTSFLEAVTVFVVFLFVVPTVYARHVLGREYDELFQKPFSVRFNALVCGGSALLGICILIGLHFTPFLDNYKSFVTPFFTVFKSFALYETLYLLPLLVLSVYFCVIFVGSLHLPKRTTLFCSIIFFNTIFIAFFDFPFYSTVLFFGGIFFLHMHLKASHPGSLLVALWMPILILDTIIAQSL